MQSLTFVLEASLLAPLVEFATSTSGHVEPRQGLALGWLGSVVAGLAVVFGAADRAQADACGAPLGGCNTVTIGPCQPGECPPPYTGEIYERTCHYQHQCQIVSRVCYC